MKVRTVVIKTENGPVIINESDFNSDIHELGAPGVTLKPGTVEWYKSELDAMSIDYSESAKKAELKELYEESIK